MLNEPITGHITQGCSLKDLRAVIMEDNTAPSPSTLGGDGPHFSYHLTPNSKSHLQSETHEKISKFTLKT